jgi:hypothetical protein
LTEQEIKELCEKVTLINQMMISMRLKNKNVL